MNASKSKIIAISVLALCVVGLSIPLFFGSGSDAPQKADKSAPTSAREAKKLRREAKKERAAQNNDQKKEKPKFNLGDSEYAGLSKEMRAIVEELQIAMENEDNKAVSRVSAKILKIMKEKGEDAVPPIVREDAVEALGLSLPAALPELMGFMADGNEDVREAVNDQLDELFSDPTIGDRNLSPIMTALAKVATDEDLIDSMLASLESDLRTSVMVATYKEILKTATEEVKEKARESIDELLEIDEDEVQLTDAQREKGLDKYLAENPDEEDDDDLFGGNADNDSDDN